MPKEIRPIFKDTSELSGGVLAKEINDALVNSKYLIVICSPRSAKSEWVCKEVQTFIDLGRTDHIIPFIIGGTPHSANPDNECFPTSLLELPKEQELLAININEMGRDAAAIKVIAQMFEVNFDTLWQRYEKEKKRRRIGIIIILLLIIVCVLTVAWFINEQRNYADAMRVKAEINENLANLRADSIREHQHQLQMAYDSLHTSEYALWESNKSLKYANHKIMVEHDGMLATQSRMIAEYSEDVSNTAMKMALLLNVLPKDLNNPNRPYIASAGNAFVNLFIKMNLELVLMHNGGANSIAFSSDGKKVLTASNDKTSCLWDLETGIKIHTFEHNTAVSSAVFSPDEKKILTAAGNHVYIWDMISGSKIDSFEQSGVANIIFSPDGKKVATTGFDCNLVDITSKEKLRNFDQEGFIHIAVFSPDGKKILTASHDNTACLWDVETSKKLQTFTHGNSILTAIFSPDGNEVLTTSGDDDTACLWDATSGKKLKAFEHSANVKSAAFSPDGKNVLTASSDNTSCLWDIETGVMIHTFKHESRVNSAVFSHDGKKILTASYDKTACLWDAETGAKISTYNHTWNVELITFSPDGNKVLTASSCDIPQLTDNAICLWDADFDIKNILAKKNFNYINVGGDVKFIEISPDGKKMLTTLKHLDKTSSYSDPKWSASVWDIKSGEKLITFSHKHCIESATFSPNGKKILTASTNTACLWDAETGERLQTFKHQGFVSSAVFNSDGKKILTASEDCTSGLWDARTGEQLKTFRHKKAVSSAQFSPNGKNVLTVSYEEKISCLWDATSGNKIHTFKHNDFINTAVFSPDNKTILTAAGSHVYIWDVISGNKIDSLKQSRVTNIRFNPDGKRVAMTGYECNLWDMTSKELILNIDTFCSPGIFNMNGNALLSYSHSSDFVIMYNIDVNDMINRGHKIINNYKLSSEDKQNYYLE